MDYSLWLIQEDQLSLRLKFRSFLIWRGLIAPSFLGVKVYMKIKLLEDVCIFDKIYAKGEVIELEREKSFSLIKNKKAELILREVSRAVVENWECR